MLSSFFIQDISSQKKFEKFFLPKTSNGVNLFSNSRAKRGGRRGEASSNSPFKTKKLGEVLGKEILRTKKTKRAPKDPALFEKRAGPTGQALILGLEGDLGGGKTTFLQGFAKGLGIKQRITSPTFVIMKKFQIPNIKFQTNSKFQIPTFQTFYHIDCYRLQKPKEILSLGFKEIISNSKNIVAIEWSDRIRKILPKETLILKFKFTDQNKREIKISPVFPFVKSLIIVK